MTGALARRLRPVCVAAAVLAIPVASASADTFTDVYKDFAKDGAVSPCKFTSAQLNKVQSEIPPDIEQYAPDFPVAVQLALETRSNGGCAKKAPSQTSSAAAPGASGSSPPPASADAASQPGAAAPAPQASTGSSGPSAGAGVTPQPEPPPATAPAAADGAISNAAQVTPVAGRSDGLPAAVVGLGTLAVLMLLASIAWLFTRTFAWEPAWMPRAQHACQEAAWRMSNTWAEFTDWIRFGR